MFLVEVLPLVLDTDAADGAVEQFWVGKVANRLSGLQPGVREKVVNRFFRNVSNNPPT